MAESKRRDEIIEVTQKLLCQKGYNGTSLSDILELTGLSKGTFYYYFASKKALCLAVIEEHRRDWEENCFQAILQNESPSEQQLCDMIDWIFAYHQSQISYYGCPVGNLTIELAAEDEDYRQPLLAFYEEWTGLIAEKLACLGEKEARLQAQQLIARIQGSILLLKVSQDLTLLKDNFDCIKQTIKNLLAEQTISA